MPVSEILDAVLPYTASDRVCGTKKMWKVRQRNALIELLIDFKDGKKVDFSTILNPRQLVTLLELMAEKTF